MFNLKNLLSFDSFDVPRVCFPREHDGRLYELSFPRRILDRIQAKYL